MANSKTQVGLRLSAENWHLIRIMSFQIGVSASNLMDALTAEMVTAFQINDPWALGVVENARRRQIETHTRPKRTPKMAKPRILAENDEMASETVGIAEI
jgi:hypothetical protein